MFTEQSNSETGILKSEFNSTNIVNSDPCHLTRKGIAYGAQDNLANLIEAVEFPFGANDITPLAFVDIAGRYGGICALQKIFDLRHCKAKSSHAFGIDNNLKFFFSAAEDVNPGNAFDPFKTVLNDVFGEIEILVHIARVSLVSP